MCTWSGPRARTPWWRVAVAETLGLNHKEIAHLAAAGVTASFLDSAAKHALLTEIAAVAADPRWHNP